MPGIRPHTPARQTAALIREHIQAGLYPVRERMPSLTQMATTYGTTVAVVRNALRFLIAEGMVGAVGGDGHYVLSQDTSFSEENPQELLDATNDAVRRSEITMAEIARRLGTSPRYISRMLHGVRPLTPDWSQRIIQAVSDPEDIVETSGP